MKIAIIGSGISGLSCAYKLHKKHDISVFEKSDRIGGHTATVPVDYQGHQYQIDTGFIVYNDRTYPNFIALLGDLGVKTRKTQMSFSVSSPNSGLEYAGSSLNTLFSQRRNIFNLPYLLMLRDVIRFNTQSVKDLEEGKVSTSMTLGEYLDKNNYGERFINHYLIPMGSAIWSASSRDMRQFPLLFFIRFFKNHGLLNITNRPQWRTIEGGSSAYLAPLTQDFSNKITTACNIKQITRKDDSAIIQFADNSEHAYDQVVFACHSDQALALLGDASKEEKEILGCIPYSENRVTLHTDTSLLPRKRRAWSSWNYLIDKDTSRPPTLSYNMNILQGIESDTTFVVTLNNDDLIDETKIIEKFNYAHPKFTLDGIAAQNRWLEINGKNRTWFCGAYWRYGFHEDGCMSGLKVAQHIEKA